MKKKESGRNKAGIDRNFIESKVKEILSDKLDIDLEDVTLDKRFIEDFGIDSFWALELMFEVEDKFGIVVPENDRIKIKTVEDIVDYIKRKLKSDKRKIHHESIKEK